ncbi:uncharacterized protein LY89DRAFT_676463 [Mollisia scopiformis]|uniref:C2H2-type domain-containing protein n=1 Tax=Mollisia scopiformis TaxID=149040 RepID=A0A132BB76_MOLSC|nr:uncharacterized protein LY89DRAFT_676463 [Mollisia scopiformis]KUJ09094.1 hypothetical protein LY89DRAFT_676463 [Mollisia scopiformis]
MNCLCYHCGVIFESRAAREIHILHLSSLPPFPRREDFTLGPYYVPVPETPRLVGQPYVVSASPFNLSPTDSSAPKVQFKFTMDPSPPTTPIHSSSQGSASMDMSEYALTPDHQPRFVMDPSPPSTPSPARSCPPFPNPFMDTHTPSPRMFPLPGQYLPTVPTVSNWASHLLATGCTKLGKGCLNNCVSGAELEESSKQSRFPLTTRVTKRTAHVKGKKSKCWICQGMFVDLMKHEKKHEKKHEEEMHWECNVCLDLFPRKWILTKHEREAHVKHRRKEKWIL